jgi:cell division protein FtsL
MNTAARGMHRHDVFHGQLAAIRVPKSLWWHIILVASVLISALSVVYTTNMHRMTLSQLEMAEAHTHQLQLQWGQLLLEQASLATPSRVQKLATEKLHMVLPSQNDTFVLRVR